MLISNVNVQNYRGLRDLSVPVSPFGCIIGENNAGKSSILQALDIFFSGPILKDSDFYDAGKMLRIEVTLDEIKDEDLARLAEEHRGRIEKVASGGRLTLSRVYAAPGKGILRQVDDVPANRKYWPSSVQEMVTGKRGDELKESAVYAFPELRDILPPKPTQKDVKEAVAALADSLHESERTKGDVDLPTGMEKSIQALLPEVIYIPAVKELSDDLKTSESASFGKLLGILVEQIKPQLADVDELFGKLRAYLNVEELPDGGVNDGRLQEVRNIEQLVEGNLQAAFPDTRVSIEIPPPDLRSVLSNATITVDDGVRGAFKSKGDGLRRSVTFAILRTYAELRTAMRDRSAAAKSRPYLLLFEEPELFLHPRAQKQLFEALRVFSQDHHVLVSTHSTSFYSPQATGTFVKIAKDRSTSPPSAVAYPIDLSHLRAKDQFQMIRQENNDAAFFSDKVLLVEGDSDHILIPHIARTLNPEWDFGKRSVAIAKVNGKSSIARYRGFFERFGVAVAVLADLDALVEGFNKLGASNVCVSKQKILMELVGETIVRSERGETDISSNVARKLRDAPAMKDLWRDATRAGELFSAGECEWEELRKSVDEFFHRAVTRDVRAELVKNPPSAEISEAKAGLISSLRQEKIYVLERGAIEDYYPEAATGDKLTAAQTFCDEHRDASALRGAIVGDDSSQPCEFDLILGSFFGSD
ncbi:ATP-dependent nuclease [Streptomyces griseus]|uniref:ATP-dependent nuclease n=1 Tax=Streptomyces griseus group TaxID=629295 RepID=UPI0022552734|nr:AAA family ATPase [Streptomyces anulatus]MCX4508593.1 ATP-dependent endonuclease [Streptomyces anulatus]WTC88328.1 ATP-dependent endonuclease [Streptomyces griseus]WTD69048.1 ATP-dependent endonuclease [Streptomyces griseus]